MEYDETSINKIYNLKSKYILDIDNVRSDNKYKQAFSNIKFTGPWSEEFQDNIITYWYNNNYLFHKIREKYDKYIIMDKIIFVKLSHATAKGKKYKNTNILYDSDIKIAIKEDINEIDIFQNKENAKIVL